MILNPVIVVSGESGSKMYTITDNVGVGFPESAEAGEIVRSQVTGVAVAIITDSQGNNIPSASVSVLSRRYVYFVMPASDVTIS